jgi:hypothetical protein
LRNIIREMGFNSVSQRFGYNFVNDITEPYRSEILTENRVRFFWDESDESSIELRRKSRIGIKIKD